MLKRLVGLIVILFVVFLLVWLVPHRQSAPETGKAIPVTAVPVGSTSARDVAAASTVPESAEGAGAESPTPGSGVQTQPYRLGETSSGSAVPPDTESGPSHEAASGEPDSASAGRAASPVHPVTPPAPLAGVGYYVQTGSYGDAGNAGKALDKLRAKGYRGDVQGARVGGKTWHRVRVGPYPSKTEAEAARRALVAAGYHGAHVVRND